MASYGIVESEPKRRVWVCHTLRQTPAATELGRYRGGGVENELEGLDIHSPNAKDWEFIKSYKLSFLANGS